MPEALRRFHEHLRMKASLGLVVDPLEPKVVEMLLEGHGRRDIARAIGVTQTRVAEVTTQRLSGDACELTYTPAPTGTSRRSPRNTPSQAPRYASAPCWQATRA